VRLVITVVRVDVESHTVSIFVMNFTAFFD
jgi:hypothetical protein